MLHVSPVPQVAVTPVRRRWRSGARAARPSWSSPVGVSGAPSRLAAKSAAGKPSDQLSRLTPSHLSPPSHSLSSPPGVLRPATTRPERPTGATPGPARPADSPACCRCPAAATPALSPATTWFWSSPSRWFHVCSQSSYRVLFWMFWFCLFTRRFSGCVQVQLAGPWEQPSEPAFVKKALPCPPCQVPIPT